MLDVQKNNSKSDEFSGLALALLFDRCFIDLFALCENNNRPLRRLRSRQSLLTKKQVARVDKREVFLSRF